MALTAVKEDVYTQRSLEAGGAAHHAGPRVSQEPGGEAGKE